MVRNEEEWVPGLVYLVKRVMLETNSLQLQARVKLRNGVDIRLEGYPAESQDNTCLLEYLEFTRQVFQAFGYLISGRFVLRRSAAHRRS